MQSTPETSSSGLLQNRGVGSRPASSISAATINSVALKMDHRKDKNPLQLGMRKLEQGTGR